MAAFGRRPRDALRGTSLPPVAPKRVPSIVGYTRPSNAGRSFTGRDVPVVVAAQEARHLHALVARSEDPIAAPGCNDFAEPAGVMCG